jgi:hypothetical protein
MLNGILLVSSVRRCSLRPCLRLCSWFAAGPLQLPLCGAIFVLSGGSGPYLCSLFLLFGFLFVFVLFLSRSAVADYLCI